MSDNIAARIAAELSARPQQVQAAVSLLDEGATVPFIARYRKEATGGLDDTQLRALEQRLIYLRDLEERRAAVLETIAEQGKLTAELEQTIRAAETKQRLEDLYLPYKKKRRTKGEIAKEAGLEPLARALLDDPANEPERLAATYVNAEAGVADAAAALEGARYILAEAFAEDPELIGRLRDYVWRHGLLCSQGAKDAERDGSKFADYFDYQEPLRKIPSHRALALFRGRRERVLRLELALPEDLDEQHVGANAGERMLAEHFDIVDRGRPADRWLAELVRFTWRVKVHTRLETDLLTQLRESAESEAIQVFGRNLRDLLLAAPAGSRATMGIDPGLRTGCKVAVVDGTGKLVATETIYPNAPQKRWDQALATLGKLMTAHGVELVAVGNGTASRETETLARELVKRLGTGQVVMVSEAGASVYSASELAAREFPDLDVSLRGAVSIARRLQDPLAELVKIDPKSIGVGQYQHDVSQSQLARMLDGVVEDCVNAVGVDLNTASQPLLARISGLSDALAENLVAYRDSQGAFPNRRALMAVPRFGEKTFEQAAGFLRIRGGDTPLDASAVHPEAYGLVERIANSNGRSVDDIIGDSGFLGGLRPSDYTDERFGVPTVQDVLRELDKPGRDPRPEFVTANLREDVQNLEDLAAGMKLEGTVTNVTQFGAFVDIGVHQDGLVHISELADRFVKDPAEVVKPGDVVQVRVLDVDLKRKRIGLSMKSEGKGGDKADRPSRPKAERRAPKAPEGAMAQAFARSRGKG
ncbi:RNA-binding transcriptional accessory protein [Ectothiorhodospiraceae bacterium WFHF3C12]|nr:RNA-binding transcriptional accessory protein [Ectothiorhodospiraceae bacterium WFHF3C12]